MIHLFDGHMQLFGFSMQIKQINQQQDKYEIWLA